MAWRRVSGACLMITGAAAAAGMIVVAFAIMARYLKLPDAANTLGGASSLTMPVMLAGGVVLLVGRWVYGEWNDRAPIVNAAFAALQSTRSWWNRNLSPPARSTKRTNLQDQPSACERIGRSGSSCGSSSR